MTLAQYSAFWAEELSREEGLLLPSCPSAKVTDGDRLYAERAASMSLGRMKVINKWGFDLDISRSVAVAMTTSCCTVTATFKLCLIH